MRKILLSIPLLAATICLYGQTGKAVGVIAAADAIPTDFPHTSAMLDVRSTSKGFLAPRIDLVSPTSAAPVTTPKKGLLVYNKSASGMAKGYYFWDGVQWLPWRKSGTTIQSFTAVGISTTTLGYVPNGTGVTAPDTFTYGNVTATKVGCAKFDTGTGATNHSYCGYELKGTVSNAVQGVNWPTSFVMAKSINGYLATVTSDEEWDFIKNNLLTAPAAQNNAWLGFNKVTYPGNPREFTWITGEKSMVYWEGSGIAAAPHISNASYEFNFAPNEPNDSSGTEGCVHIQPTSQSANRLWNDVACNSISVSSAPVSYLIVEFQN